MHQRFLARQPQPTIVRIYKPHATATRGSLHTGHCMICTADSVSPEHSLFDRRGGVETRSKPSSDESATHETPELLSGFVSKAILSSVRVPNDPLMCPGPAFCPKSSVQRPEQRELPHCVHACVMDGGECCADDLYANINSLPSSLIMLIWSRPSSGGQPGSAA